jgi:TonB-dependent receptor
METLTLTADGLYAQNKVDEKRAEQTNWFTKPFSEVTFDDDDTVATAIYLREELNGVKDIGFESVYRATKSQLQSYGLNANWEIADGFSLNLDANTSRSKSTPNAKNGTSSTLVGIGAPVVTAHSVDFTGDVPQQDWEIDDSIWGNGNGILDLGDLGTAMGRTNTSSQRHRLNQFRADLNWELDAGTSFSVGAVHTDSVMTSARVQTQQTLGNWGSTASVGDIEQFAPGMVEQYCLQCQFDHYSPTNAEVAFRANAVDLMEIFSPLYAADGSPLVDGVQPGNPVDITGNEFDRVKEKVWAGYAQLTWAGEIAGREAGLAVGARYETTKVSSFAEVDEPAYIRWESDNDFRRGTSGNIVGVTLEGEYNNLLPAVDFHIEPMDDVVARVSYSKTLARPDYGNLFASQSANAPPDPTYLGARATGTSGNPNLRPLVSDNFDVSLEWYYGRSSYVSAGFFSKKVKNFVGTGQVEMPLFGLRDPSSGAPGSRSGIAAERLEVEGIDVTNENLYTLTGLLVQNGGDIDAAWATFDANFDDTANSLDRDFVDEMIDAVDIVADVNDPLFNFYVSTPINNRAGNIHGFEIQGQHFFGDTGFGISGSFTKVYGDVNVDRGSDPNEDVFALVGLSDSFNITGIYENYGFSARVAYNWRDKFLSGVNRGATRNPVFVDSFGTLDVSVSYDLSDQIALSLEAINVLSEPIRTYGRSERQLWSATELKPRILLGARYRF